MDEQTIVKNSLLKIFHLNGFHDPSGMTQRDFEHISAQIENKAGIVLSGTTIKRLSNGAFSRLPQIATLNAIANYFGFATWQEYKLSEASPGKVESQIQKVKPVQKSGTQLLYLAPVIIGVSVLVMLFFVNKENSSLGDLEKVVFQARKSTDNKIPNSVVFTYNVDHVNADSFFIQQSWDDRRRVQIFKNQYTLTDIYYEPGYHIAKLIANDSIIRVVEVNIPTDRWFFYVNEYKSNYRSMYLDVKKPMNQGILGISKEDLVLNNVDTRENLLYINSYFPTKQEVSGDNFRLNTRVRMTEINIFLCPFITIEVFCQHNYIITRSTERGCASEAFAQFGNRILDGKRVDLGNITFDVKEWNDIELLTNDKKVTMLVNGKMVYETTYEHSTKNITGLAFISNGLCEVDYVNLTGSDGSVFYDSEFDETP